MNLFKKWVGNVPGVHIRVPLFLGMLAILCSCAHQMGPHFRTGSGDAGKFIVKQAVQRGAEPIRTRGLPAVPGSWRYATDNSGVIIRLPLNEYAALEALLLQAFGPPQFGPIDTVSGKLGAYRITARGAMIHYGHDAQITQVIVLRERNDADTAADFLRGLQ